MLCSESPAATRAGLAALGLAVALAAEVGAAGETAVARPRPISPAERAAVELALGYATRGPAAVVERLAPDSWLADLGPAAAAEIAVRCGPSEGAVWRLQTPPPEADPGLAIFSVEFPSGIDDAVAFRFVEKGGWRLAEVRTLADPRELAGARQAGGWLFEAGRKGPFREKNEGRFRVASSSPLGKGSAAFLAVLLAGALVVLSRTSRTRLGSGVALAALALVVLACPGKRSDAKPEAVTSEATALRLGPLEPLRRALATATDRASFEALAAQAGAADGGADARAQIARLWRAQLALVEGDAAGAGKLLAPAPGDAAVPLADLLRARLATLTFALDRMRPAYREALDGAGEMAHDGLRYEAAGAIAMSGDDSAAAAELSWLVGAGSRLAEAWYGTAAESYFAERVEEAVRFLEVAWELAPLPRSDLFGDPVSAALVARPEIFPLFDLANPREPTVVPAVVEQAGGGGAARPVALPPGFTGTLAGAELALRGPGFELVVPNGAALAAPGAPVEDAAARARRREEAAAAALPQLVAAARSGRAFAPRQNRLAETAATALVRERRWSDLLDLTAALATRVEAASPRLARIRALALRRLDREIEARDLLIRLAKRELASRRPSPGTLFDLADVVAATGDYDTAIQLVRRADARLPFAFGQQRLRQYEMSRDLEVDARSFASAHFEIRYPRGTGERYARQLATVLEQERRRISRWVPEPANGKIAARVTVELFPVQQFLSSYGGDVEVVGLYDGRVRVPFADLRSLHPELVAILSHELAHAMIAGATHDLAPNWFHEGLAQHVEMGTGRVNPLPDLAASDRRLAFPAIEPILDGFAEAQLVDLAYAEAAWAVHFLEARWGIAALHRLQGRFAAGETTEEAIAAVTGLSPEAFDRAFWAWGSGIDAPRARSLEVRRYDLEYDGPVERAVAPDGLDAPGRAARSSPVPAVASARPATPAVTASGEAARSKVAAWHAEYARRAAAVKAAYRPILGVYRDTAAATSAPLPSDCETLAAESRRLAADPRAFESSDPVVDQRLRELYRLLGDLGEACKAGRAADARQTYAQVGHALTLAAEALSPYGLSP